MAFLNLTVKKYKADAFLTIAVPGQGNYVLFLKNAAADKVKSGVYSADVEWDDFQEKVAD